MGRFNRRPQMVMPWQLKGLLWNPLSRFYEITEHGITYQMDLEATRVLRHYFRYFPSGYEKQASVHRWFRDLPNEMKKKVNRLGDLPKPIDDFYPDVEYPD